MSLGVIFRGVHFLGLLSLQGSFPEGNCPDTENWVYMSEAVAS